MKELMYLLRAMQIFGHNAHLLVKGQSFLQDHELFGSFYSELESDFDSVSERIIGIYGEESLNLQQIMASVSNKLQDAPSISVSDNNVYFTYQLKLEDKLTDIVKQIILAGISPGTEQLIGDISNKSESRKYKIKQRLKQ